MIKTMWPITLVVVLAGCVNMSGLDANSRFACKAPDGILCQSMSGIYASAQAKKLPSQRSEIDSEQNIRFSQAKSEKSVMTPPLYAGMPIRSDPRIIRVWFAPWEDTDGDLHDQSYVYLLLDVGQWRIDHHRLHVQDTDHLVHAPSDSVENGRPTEIEDIGQQKKSPSTDHTVPQADNEQESIGVRQDRMTDEQATELMNGIIEPRNVISEHQ